MSSDIDASSGVPASTSPPPQVLAAGHLHPGMLFLRFVEGLWRSVLPMLLALLAPGQLLWLAEVTIVFFLVSMAFAVVRYLTFQYRLTTEELITVEGILHRQERRIPVNRIQDMSFEQTLLRRFLGLVVVTVETASAHGSEAKLDCLSRPAADQLRAALYATRGAAAQVAVEPEAVLCRSSSAELVLLGLTSNRVGALLLALLGLYQLGADFGVQETIGNVFGGLFARAARLGTALLAVLAIGVVFLALLAGWAVSVGAALLMFHGFTLSRRENVFQRRYGLFTTRARSLPRRKIQRVLIEQNFLRRLLRVAQMRADSAGSGMDPRVQAKGGLDVVAPLAHESVAEALVPQLLPGCDLRRFDWLRVSPRMVVRVFVKGAVVTLASSAALYGVVGWSAAALLAFLPGAYLLGVLAYRNMAYGWVDGHLAMRWGVLGRYRAFIPLRKVQAAVLTANPLDRRLGLARLTVYVAGGSPTTVRNLVREEAHALMLATVHGAARARFVW